MQRINHHPPELLSPTHRRLEVASLFALGLARLSHSGAKAVEEQPVNRPVLLGFSGDQRVHTDTVNNQRTESQ